MSQLPLREGSGLMVPEGGDGFADVLLTERVGVVLPEFLPQPLQVLLVEGVANYFPHALPDLPLGRPLSPEINSQIKITNAGDAYRLCISINPVCNHRSNLFKKTNARNMVDLVKRTTLIRSW